MHLSQLPIQVLAALGVQIANPGPCSFLGPNLDPHATQLPHTLSEAQATGVKQNAHSLDVQNKNAERIVDCA